MHQLAMNVDGLLKGS